MFLYVNSLSSGYTTIIGKPSSSIAYRISSCNAQLFLVTELKKKKPVVYCGDLNVAHEPIDLKNDKTNHNNAGFTDEERAKMSQLLAAGFTDTFRYLYPEKEEYSWWSYRMNARARNTGWRIDYFIVSDELKDKIREAVIYGDVLGSDHAPVGLVIDL